MDKAPLTEAPEIFTLTSALSLLATLVLLGAAYWVSSVYLPRNASGKIRVLAVWHLFDVLIHTFLEGSYLYSCFFAYSPLDAISSFPAHQRDSMTAPGVYFMGQENRLYGAFYGTTVMSKLWQEYAAADRRWGGSDLTVISLEFLTVGVMGPLALYVFTLLARGRNRQAWFWACVIATGELYGGWMTFCPEWLTGSPNLSGQWFHKWIYLFFFNTIWVWIPLWILYQGYYVLIGTEDAATAMQKKVR